MNAAFTSAIEMPRHSTPQTILSCHKPNKNRSMKEVFMRSIGQSRSFFGLPDTFSSIDLPRLWAPVWAQSPPIIDREIFFGDPEIAGDENYNVYAVNPADAPTSGQDVPAVRNLTESLCLKSRSRTWIGSVQGAVATWSNHGSQKSLEISHADH